jgi:hypothetical protein
LTAEVFKGPGASVNWQRYFDDVFSAVGDAMESSTSPFVTAYTNLPYPVGGEWLQAAFDIGRSEVADVYAAPPSSLLDEMTGYVAPRPASRLEDLDCYPPLPPSTHEVVTADQLGPAALIALLVAHDVSFANAYKLANSYRGDLLAVYWPKGAKNADDMLLAWRIRMASASAAKDLAAKLADIEPAEDVAVDDREVLIHGAAKSATYDAWSKRSGCANADELANSFAPQPSAISRYVRPAPGMPTTLWLR